MISFLTVYLIIGYGLFSMWWSSYTGEDKYDLWTVTKVCAVLLIPILVTLGLIKAFLNLLVQR